MKREMQKAVIESTEAKKKHFLALATREEGKGVTIAQSLEPPFLSL